MSCFLLLPPWPFDYEELYNNDSVTFVRVNVPDVTHNSNLTVAYCLPVSYRYSKKQRTLLMKVCRAQCP